MLVTLGVDQSISAGGSVTLSYSPESVQKVLIYWDDNTSTDAMTGSVTVQIGSTTVVNGISNFGLQSISGLQSDGTFTTSDINTCIDFGSIVCGPNENLYVTVSATAEITAADISAVINEPLAGDYPIKYTEYSDSTFTCENALIATCYDSAQQPIFTDNKLCEIRTPTSASSTNFVSANNYYQSSAVSGASLTYFGLLFKNEIPMNTSFNYDGSAVTDRIIVAQAMGQSRYSQNKSKAMANEAINANKKVLVQK